MPGFGKGLGPSSLNLMASRLGVFDYTIPAINPDKTSGEKLSGPPPDMSKDGMKLGGIEGINDHHTRLHSAGGFAQQERMIFDKRRSLDRALIYSYQGADIRKYDETFSELIVRGLINPNKNKVDYDDKILSIPYEVGYKPGDVFEWLGTRSHWLIYLQDLTELAYFRGDIRRCSYQISWEDEDGLHTTYAAVRGPVETKIDYIQKHQISVDNPNYSLHILMPRNEATLKYFRRYSRFYLQGADKGSQEVCWRVEAIDWISTPGILEITAIEYYINETEDDVENGIVGGLIVEPENPNDVVTEDIIIGDTFIKPKKAYTYEYQGPVFVGSPQWTTDKKYPVDIIPDEKNSQKVTIKWKSSYSGQFELQYGGYSKIIVVESLF